MTGGARLIRKPNVPSVPSVPAVPLALADDDLLDSDWDAFDDWDIRHLVRR
jgi:hypothetical protein